MLGREGKRHAVDGSIFDGDKRAARIVNQANSLVVVASANLVEFLFIPIFFPLPVKSLFMNLVCFGVVDKLNLVLLRSTPISLMSTLMNIKPNDSKLVQNPASYY
ncbi:hypothetical protein E2542_SST00143 [Spatholobus suberectus]|nr:hypothetical protein E2542_SST00143 [Spatholobus suberectus]